MGLSIGGIFGRASARVGVDVGEVVADLGEFGVIDRILAALPGSQGLEVGNGDDAAVVALRGAAVVSVDALVEGRHFRPEWCSAENVGRRGVAAAMADISAMGGTCRGVLLSVGVPADTPTEWVEELVVGAAEEAAQAQAQVLGGDLVRSEAIVLSVTALGQIQSGTAVTRSGAGPGDIVALAGRQGWAAAGLTVLSRGFRSPRALVQAYQNPAPPYASGPEAAALGASAMIDVSDGLLADAQHLATASGVSVSLDSERIPVSDQLVATSSAFNVDPLTWVLAGGDDHSLLATFPEPAELPELFHEIGRVVEATDRPQVSVDGRVWNGQGGHDHFR